MLIIPAIDIINGQCVRLTKGNFKMKKIYNNDPIKVAKDFQKQGAKMLHIIDLDGARSGEPKNFALIKKIRKAVRIPIEVGGGIRNFKTAQKYLSLGIERIILGTKAATNLELMRELIKKFGNKKVVAAIDVKRNKILIQGWEENGRINFETLLRELKSIGIKEVIVTDTERDGTLGKPNFKIVESAKNLGLQVIAAGGISDMESVNKLNQMGIYGAIIGKAMYEGRMGMGIDNF